MSVIIPVYNAESYLQQCLDSLASQTLENIEVICIDDGSTDESSKILQDYAVKDGRFIVLRQRNQFAGVARNAGLEIARGEYLSFLDADDFFAPGMLEKMSHRADEQQADIVICRCQAYDQVKRSFEPMDYALKRELLPRNDPFSFKDVIRHVFSFCIGWPWDKLYRASFVRRANLRFQDLRTTNDALFVFASLVKASRISVVDEVLATHRTHTMVSISQTREQSWRCFYQAARSLRDELLSMGIFTWVEQAFVNWALDFCLWNLDTLSGVAQRQLYQELRLEIFSSLGIEGKPADYFYDLQKFIRYLDIKAMPFIVSPFGRLRLVGRFYLICRRQGLAAALIKTGDKLLHLASLSHRSKAGGDYGEE